jgi:hypothetical protein
VLSLQLVQPADGLLDARPPVGGERGEHGNQRQHDEEAEAMMRARGGGPQPDRRERPVDQVDGAHHARHRGRRDPAPEPLARGRGHGVGRALGGERRGDHRERREVRRGLARRHDHQARADGVPGVGHAAQQPLGMGVAAEAGEDQSAGDPQRDAGRGQQEEHRHEHELRRHRVAGADVEAHARGDRVAGDEHEGDVDVEAAIARQQHRHGQRYENQSHGGDRLDTQFTRSQPAWPMRSPALEETLDPRRRAKALTGQRGGLFAR